MISREQVLAGLVIELLQIERSIKESEGWMHEGLCDCEQCLCELAKQRKLTQARNRVLAEIAQLGRELE